ncbi:MAG: hypothetical protein JWM16_531 [Verrucomicrobiales bacterium]|nr:hypothetical protein [Verrucomicrobiales bacterium]
MQMMAEPIFDGKGFYKLAWQSDRELLKAGNNVSDCAARA